MTKLLFLLPIILLGCSKTEVKEIVQHPQPIQEPQIIVSDVRGHKYMLLKKEKIITNNISSLDEWQKIDPPDTNVYFKALGSWDEGLTFHKITK